MRTGPELIKATKPFAKDSAIKSWWCILSTAVLLAAVLVGTIWNLHWTGRVICSGLAGLLILRLFVLYHDQQHHAILPHSRLAEWMMRAFGILVLSPSSVWRSSHNYHHNHNSKLRSAYIGSFPVMTTEQYQKSTPRQRRAYLFTRHPLTILFGYLFIFLHGMCLYPFWNAPRKSLDCLAALIVHALIGLSLLYFLGWQAWLLTQIIPHFLASAIGSYLFYAQHNFPTVSFADREGWTYEKAALESSSFMKTNRIMAWFSANIGYHHIHHLNARIPFYRLPETFDAMPELQNAKITSLHPSEILHCLKLKLWDVDSQRMVPLPRV